MTNTETLPRDITAERYIIGVLVRFPDAADDVFARLTATDFFDAEHAKIFRAAQKQFADGGIDSVLLAREVGAAQTLVELGMNPANAPATAVHIATEAAKIVECRRKRQLFQVADDARHAALNGHAFDDTLRSLTADLDDMQRDNQTVLDLPKASAFEVKIVDWAWPGYLHRGGLTLLDGDPERGKSQITIDVAARWTYPRPFPFTTVDHFREPGNVLIVASEDGISTTTVPRLQAAGANLDRVLVWPELAEPIKFPSGLNTLATAIKQHDIGLAILDPITAYLDDDINSNRDADVRRALRPLVVLAQETNLAVLGVRHLNKDEGKSALYRGGGSIGFTATARVVWAVGTDPSDPNRFIFGVLKSNIARKPPSLSYSIESVDATSRIRWEGESTCSAADIFGRKHERGGKLGDAEQILLSELADGPRREVEIRELCHENGIRDWTYKQARKRLGINADKGSFREGWILSLPEADEAHEEVGPSQEVGEPC